jgi:hypothetical protein
VWLYAKRTILKSPVREFRTPGFVRGQLGNWLFYLDGVSMFDFMRNLLWRRKTERQVREEIGDKVFHNIPSDKARKGMNPRRLSVLLSGCEKNSPAYILVEHELNRRIAKIQALPAYIGVVSGFVGVILGAWLNSAFQSSQTINCVYPTSTAKETENKELNRPTPPRAITVPKKPIKSLSGTTPAPNEAHNKNPNGNHHPLTWRSRGTLRAYSRARTS